MPGSFLIPKSFYTFVSCNFLFMSQFTPLDFIRFFSFNLTWTKTISHSLRMASFIVILFLIPENVFSQNLPALPKVFQKKEAIADSLFTRAHSLIYSQPDSARSIIMTMREQGANHPQTTWNIRTLNMLGIIEDVQSVYDRALFYYYKAYSAAAALKDEAQLGHTCNNIGLTHWHTGNYKDALNYFFQALDHYENAGVTHTKGNIHNNIGLIYAGFNNFEKAREEYRLARENFKASDDLRGLGAVFTNKGLLHLTWEQPDSALFFIEKSTQYKEKTKDSYGKCISIESRARIYLFKGELELARKHFTESLELSQSIGYHYGTGRGYRGLALVSVAEKDYNGALSRALKAFEVAENIESEKLIYQIHETIATIHEHAGNYQKSLEHFKLASELKAESINHNRLHQIYDLVLQHANKKSLQEIEQLSQEKEIQQLELERRALELSRKNTLIVLIMAVFVMIMGALYFLYNNYKHRQHARLQQANMKNKENLSRAAIEAELHERKRISQELHDGMGQMLSVVRMNVGVLKKKNNISQAKREELFDSALQTVDQAFKELRNISQNLSPAIISEMSLSHALNTITRQVNQSGQVSLQMETIGLENIRDHITETTIYRSIQELINNALKHSQAKEISVQVLCDNNQTSIMVEDNGKGIDQDLLSLSDGKGLKNIQTRIENLNGSFFMDARKNRGAIIQIFIPLKNQLS